MCVCIYIYIYIHIHVCIHIEEHGGLQSMDLQSQSDTTEVTKHAYTHTHEKSEIISHLVAIPHSMKDFFFFPNQRLNPNLCLLQ